jgi:hypothetical protein
MNAMDTLLGTAEPDQGDLVGGSVSNPLATSLQTPQSNKSDKQGDSMFLPANLAAEITIATEPGLLHGPEVPVSIGDDIAAGSVRLDTEQTSGATIAKHLKRKIQLTDGRSLEETDTELSGIPDGLSGCSEAQALKRARIEPTPAPLLSPATPSKRAMRSLTAEEIATEELVRALSSRRSARIAKRKDGLESAAAVNVARYSNTVNETAKRGTTRRSNANAAPTGTRLTRGSVASKQSSQIPESNNALGGVTATVEKTIATSVCSVGSTTSTAPRGISGNRSKPTNRVTKWKEGTKGRTTKPIILKLSTPALEQALGLSPEPSLVPTPGQVTPVPPHEGFEQHRMASVIHGLNNVEPVLSTDDASASVLSERVDSVQPVLSHPQVASSHVRRSTCTRTTPTCAQVFGDPPLSSPIVASEPTSPSPCAPALQYPLTPDDTPRREKIPGLDLPHLPASKYPVIHKESF